MTPVQRPGRVTSRPPTTTWRSQLKVMKGKYRSTLLSFSPPLIQGKETLQRVQCIFETLITMEGDTLRGNICNALCLLVVLSVFIGLVLFTFILSPMQISGCMLFLWMSENVRQIKDYLESKAPSTSPHSTCHLIEPQMPKALLAGRKNLR